MSLTVLQLAARCRQCSGAFQMLRQPPQRQFHFTPSVLARKGKEKKLAKRPKSVYLSEKMPLESAIEVLRAVDVARPYSTYELVVKTGMGNGITIPKGRFALPKPTKEGSKDVILVFAEGRQADEAKKAGADIVGGAELIEGVISGRYRPTLFLATTSMIRPITPRLGRLLGPRGLMPSERRGTVTDDVGGYIKRLKGTIEWKGDKEGTIRQSVAKMHFTVPEVITNIRYFMHNVKRATNNIRDRNVDSREADSKPVNSITRVLLTTSQGPSIQISDL
ncbi:ribosomal protein L1 [Epithele typhae]|uniref:ribosomal protein L1 n=1 Tax=Epithele typhae TaxID=378194 RepID=UPI0020078024|nr:ribosomal protein L1 [Epithele typhae]KAH9943985.1 ribosomal protein L1 [Epithele typhae]